MCLPASRSPSPRFFPQPPPFLPVVPPPIFRAPNSWSYPFRASRLSAFLLDSCSLFYCSYIRSNVYVGEWQRGQREGKGVLSLANGDRYAHRRKKGYRRVSRASGILCLFGGQLSRTTLMAGSCVTTLQILEHD